MRPLVAPATAAALVLLAGRMSVAQPAPELGGPVSLAPSPAPPASETGPTSAAPPSSMPPYSPVNGTGGTSSVSLATPPAALPPQTQPPAPPYALPFQLRSASPRSGLRVDTIVAPHRIGEENALATVVFVSGQVRLHQHVFLQARWGFNDNRVGTGARNRTGFVNPSLGIALPFRVGAYFRFSAFTSMGLPFATGGGGEIDADDQLLHRQSALARSAMDNSAFTPNHLGVPTGVSLAFVHGGATIQVDATIIPSGRVRGTAADNDGARVNSTTGLFLGYYVIPEISLGAELRYQYFLVPPAFVDQEPAARDNLTVGAGGRLDIELSDSTRIRPGICLSTGLAGYVEQQSYRMLQFDVPVSF